MIPYIHLSIYTLPDGSYISLFSAITLFWLFVFYIWAYATHKFITNEDVYNAVMDMSQELKKLNSKI